MVSKTMIILFVSAYILCVSVLSSSSSARNCQNKMLPAKRIINGEIAGKWKYPYVVAIFKYGTHICGGTIITPQHILTAAHCLDGRGPFTIVAGTYDLREMGHKRQVETIVIHPEFSYDYTGVKYDIAVAVLNSSLPIIFPEIMMVRLPPFAAEIPNEYGTVLGWGDTEDEKIPSATILLGVDLIKQECNVSEHFFCLGHPDGNKDSCDGDSGGPFIINNTLYGIVSHSFSPYCAKGSPGVYVKVPFFVRWIVDTIVRYTSKEPIRNSTPVFPKRILKYRI